MTELLQQEKKEPLISRIKGFWRNRGERPDEIIHDLDNSHRSSRHAVSLDEISNFSKLTNPTEEYLDTSDRKFAYDTSASSETVTSPVRIEEETSEGDEEQEEAVEPSEQTIPTLKEPMSDPMISNSERHVRFSTVNVREYPIVMGDNPGSSRGVPIAIGWEILDETVQQVEIHQYRLRTSNLQGFRLAPLDRVLMLKRVGYSGGEISEGTDQVDRLRAQRKRTASRLSFAGVEERLERLQRSLLNSTIRRSRKQKEREYLYQYKSELSTPFESATCTFRAPAKLKDSIVISGGKSVYLD